MGHKKNEKKKENRKKQQNEKKLIADLLELKEKMMKVDPENTARLPFPQIQQKPPNPAFMAPLDILQIY